MELIKEHHIDSSTNEVKEPLDIVAAATGCLGGEGVDSLIDTKLATDGSHKKSVEMALAILENHGHAKGSHINNGDHDDPDEGESHSESLNIEEDTPDIARL